MNRMPWKAAMGAALLGLCSFAAYAQSPTSAAPATDGSAATPHGNWRHGGMGPERELERLTHTLTLTADQQTGVKALLEQQSTQMRALHQKSQSESGAANTSGASETPGSQQTQMAQIRDETDTKISALLNEDQKKTFADWVARRKAAMARRQGQGGNPSEAPPAPQE